MTTQVQSILTTFEALPEDDKRELASEILRRSMAMETPALSDDQLTAVADELFLGLER